MTNYSLKPYIGMHLHIIPKYAEFSIIIILCLIYVNDLMYICVYM